MSRSAAPHGLIDERAQRREHLTSKHARARFQQRIEELIDPWRREGAQLYDTDLRDDVMLKVGDILGDRGTLQPIALSPFYPELTGFGNGNRLRVGDVQPSRNVVPDLHKIGVSV